MSYLKIGKLTNNVHPWNQLILVRDDNTTEHVGFVFPTSEQEVKEVLKRDEDE